jgi:hypothetical protein
MIYPKVHKDILMYKRIKLKSPNFKTGKSYRFFTNVLVLSFLFSKFPIKFSINIRGKNLNLLNF